MISRFRYVKTFFVCVAAPTPVTYYPTIPTVVESGAGRKIDPVRLRDFRKRLDGGNVTFKEVEDIAADCMDDIVDLCSGKRMF
jgi:hypothetical protein